MSVEILLLFLVATLTVNFTPGPSILYVTTVASSSGIKAGLISILGMSIGIFAHVLAAATGVTALISASPIAFTVAKNIGALYLVYLGIGLLTSSKPDPKTLLVEKHNSLWNYFVRGIFVDLLNPKIGIFFLAFLPQFLNLPNPVALQQTLFLGGIFIIVGGLVNSLFAILAAQGARLAGPRLEPFVERWIPGSVLLLLGVRLAFSKR